MACGRALGSAFLYVVAMPSNEGEARAPDDPPTECADRPVGATELLAATPVHNVEPEDALRLALDTVESLRVGLLSRTVIGESVGLLMGRYNVNSDTAFAMLVRESSVTNTKVRVLAEAIVTAANSGVDAPGGVMRAIRLHEPHHTRPHAPVLDSTERTGLTAP
jgi:hypothetical protein